MTKKQHNILAEAENLFRNGDYPRRADKKYKQIRGIERKGYSPGIPSWAGEGLWFLITTSEIYKLISGKDTGHKFDNVEIKGIGSVIGLSYSSTSRRRAFIEANTIEIG